MVRQRWHFQSSTYSSIEFKRPIQISKETGEGIIAVPCVILINLPIGDQSEHVVQNKETHQCQENNINRFRERQYNLLEHCVFLRYLYQLSSEEEFTDLQTKKSREAIEQIVHGVEIGDH